MNTSGILFSLLTTMAAISALPASVNAAGAETQPGYRAMDIEASHRTMPLAATAFYPAASGGERVSLGGNPVFLGVEALQNAMPASGQHPLVLLSHGLGGHTGTLGWLGAGLARRGAIVVAVNHPGSTTRDFDMLRGLDHGTRVQDLQAVLDQLSADDTFGSLIDTDRIHAAGFSYGGWTALSMGGLTGNLQGYARHCRQVGDASTHCRDLQRAGIQLTSLDDVRWNASYKDERIRSVMAIDPGLLYGLQKAQVSELLDDVLLIGLGEGTDRLLATDFSTSGSGFASLLEGAQVLNIAPANHFTTFPVCKPIGPQLLEEEGDEPVCTDPSGADRSVVHAQVIERMAAFIGL